jgi:hypothetical protein
MTARVVLRQGQASRQPRFLQRARRQAAELKSDGDLTSEVRMNRFREMDRQREAEVAENLARERARDRKLLIASAGALGILVIAIVISLLAAVLH